MKASNFRISVLMFVMIAIVTACGGPITIPGMSDPASTEAMPTDVPAIAEANVPPNDSGVQHSTIPVGLPANQNGQAGDFDSSKILGSSNLIGGDRFTFGRFERPFNANSMDFYFSELDIVNTEVFQDDLWIYGRLSIKELSATSSIAQYAVELDTDLNGKAEWLIVADKPASTEWTVTGVRVYQDANQNVGGVMSMQTDDVKPNSDGFETLLFDQGNGENPDTAWVRISPTDANIVEFSINRAALANPARYLINFWAGRSINPAIFDLNDTYTHEEAGAADAGLEYFYPIKAIAEVDNSCRMAVGFQPNGNEPGICPVSVPDSESPSAPVAPDASCPANNYKFCVNGTCYCTPVLITIPNVITPGDIAVPANP